jgi:hypothetical protein
VIIATGYAGVRLLHFVIVDQVYTARVQATPPVDEGGGSMTLRFGVYEHAGGRLSEATQAVDDRVSRVRQAVGRNVRVRTATKAKLI